MPEFPAKIRTRQLVLDVIPDRKKPPIFFYDEGLRCTFAYQKQKAPLVFLIAGAGASDRASQAYDHDEGLLPGRFPRHHPAVAVQCQFYHLRLPEQ